MLRIVADTNLYVSALNFGGTPDEVLALGRRGEIAIFISIPILHEIEGVLSHKFKWSPARAQEAIRAIRAFTYLVQPEVRLQVIKEDEPDNRILECAVQCDAQMVVTGDSHLRKLRQFRGIAILNPTEFFKSRGWLEPD